MKSGIVGPNCRGSYAFPQKFCSFGSGLAKLLLVKEHLFPPYKMFKKIIKYTFRVVLCGLVLLIVLPFLFYIPGIQNFIRRQAESYVARNTEMRLSVRQIRLSFPLRLVVDDVMVSTPVLDTMAYCTRLEADVALWPLLRGRSRRTSFRVRRDDGELCRFAGAVRSVRPCRAFQSGCRPDRSERLRSGYLRNRIGKRNRPAVDRKGRRIPRRRLKESRLPGKYG